MKGDNVKPASEIMQLISKHITESALLKLIQSIKEIEDNFGTDVNDLISDIDHYVNYYVFSEGKKREIAVKIDLFQNNERFYTGEQLLESIRKECYTTGFEAEYEKDMMFNMTLLKKMISDLAIVFALNLPTQERKMEDAVKKYNLNS